MTAKLWRRFVVLLLLSLGMIAFGWYGGDRPEDRVLEPLPQAELRLLCPRVRDGLPLRLAIEHRADQGIPYHECIYGEIRRWSAM